MPLPENRLVAVVLAAGLSKRFGDENKLHAMLGGEVSILESVFRTVDSFPFADRVVVSAPNDSVLSNLAKRYGVRIVVNDQPKLGIGSSISCGVSSLDSSRYSGAAILLGDMPYIRGETITEVAEKFVQNQCIRIVRPSFNGQPGHPVIFPTQHWQELSQLTGDEGASRIIKQNINQTDLLVCRDGGVIKDIDIRSEL